MGSRMAKIVGLTVVRETYKKTSPASANSSPYGESDVFYAIAENGQVWRLDSGIQDAEWTKVGRPVFKTLPFDHKE